MPHDFHISPMKIAVWFFVGLVDVESSLAERSEQFFSELQSFRQVNRDECVHSSPSGSVSYFTVGLCRLCYLLHIYWTIQRPFLVFGADVAYLRTCFILKVRFESFQEMVWSYKCVLFTDLHLLLILRLLQLKAKSHRSLQTCISVRDLLICLLLCLFLWHRRISQSFAWHEGEYISIQTL